MPGSGIIIPDQGSLEKLYQGALVGTALAKSIGTGAATGEDINNSVRTGLLQAGIASGKINPASLSPNDTALLKTTGIQGAGLLGDLSKNPIAKATPVGGVLGDIGGLFKDVGSGIGTGLNVVGQNISGALHTAEGIPQGLYTIGRSAVNKLYPEFKGSGPDTTPTPNQILSDTAKQTVQDFTHVTPGTLYKPALDILSVPGAGTAIASRVGRLGEIAADASKGASAIERPALPVHPDAFAQQANDSLQSPSITRPQSAVPFRRMVTEPAVDALMSPKPLRALQTKYNLHKLIDVTRGRAAAGSVASSAQELEPLRQAYSKLVEESLNPQEASLKSQAAELHMKLGASRAETPEDALKILENFQKDILRPTGEREEVRPSLSVQEDQLSREQADKTASSPQFREFFSKPTPAMQNFGETLKDTAFRTRTMENIDPWTHVQNALGRAAYVEGKTVDQLIGEMPPEFKASATLAKGLDELKSSILEAGGEEVPQEALIPQLASSIPGGDLAQKVKIIQDAVSSFKSDLKSNESAVARKGPDYLPGRTLNAKIGTALVDRLHMDPYAAQRFMAADPVGEGLTPTYFPSVDNHGMKYMNTRGPLGRAARKLQGLPQEYEMRDFKSGIFGPATPEQQITAHSIGLVRSPGYLKEGDLTPFKQGIERSDVKTIMNHVIQRQRHVVGSYLSDRMMNQISIKNPDGSVALIKDPNELVTRLGSKEAANKFVPMPAKLASRLMTEEDHVFINVAESLQRDDTPEAINGMIDESAQETVREMLGGANEGTPYIPVEAYNRLVQHAKITSRASGLLGLEQRFISRWRYSVLSLMPSWFVRTTLGHGLILFISGTSTVPGLTRYARLVSEGREGFHVGGFGLEEPGQISYPAGVQQGALDSEMGATAAQRQVLSRLSLGRTVQSGVHHVMNFQRETAFIHNLETRARMANIDLGQGISDSDKVVRKFQNPQQIQKLIETNPELAHQALNDIDRISYSFGQMSPMERRLSKYGIPFWGWYKFATKFVWSLPVTYPGRADLLSKLGQMGLQEQDQAGHGAIPDWLHNSILLGMGGNGIAHYISMQGLNPLGDPLDPFGDNGQVGTSAALQLGQLNPITQAFLQGMGYNTLTGGLESISPTSGIIPISGTYYNTDPSNPQEYSTLGGVDFLPRFAGNLMRSFPQVRDLEQLYTQGRSVYPESIPLIDEKLIPTQNPKPANFGSFLMGFTGVGPKQYALGNYQQNQLKKVVEALRTKARDEAKAKALNP